MGASACGCTFPYFGIRILRIPGVVKYMASYVTNPDIPYMWLLYIYATVCTRTGLPYHSESLQCALLQIVSATVILHSCLRCSFPVVCFTNVIVKLSAGKLHIMCSWTAS